MNFWKFFCADIFCLVPLRSCFEIELASIEVETWLVVLAAVGVISLDGVIFMLSLSVLCCSESLESMGLGLGSFARGWIEVVDTAETAYSLDSS